MRQIMIKRFILLFICFSFLMVSVSVYATVFYVDSSSGADSNKGISPEKAWKSIAKINKTIFSPGDVIKFKRGLVWQETLIINSSGTLDKPILFTAYGEGVNPKIKCSNSFSSWQLEKADGEVKIWRGVIEGLRNPLGALRNNIRVPMYFPYDVPDNKWSAPGNLLSMENAFFYAPYGQPSFFFRWDAGNPGTMEIGARAYGILIEGEKFIVLDSIDVSGPEGEESGHGLVSISHCDHIIVRNCTLSFNSSFGAVIKNNSSNCTYENLQSFGHKSTGLYFWEAGEGNKAIQCHVHDCGGTATDYGDKGLIGIWKTRGVLIERCYVHNNGSPAKRGEHFDAAISFVQSPDGIVKRTLIKDVAGTALQFAENSDGGMAVYNVIDAWGLFSTDNSNDGLRIGGGASGTTAKNCSVYNNLFIHGGKTKGEWAALRIFHRVNDALQIVNNIFYNNIGVYDIFADSKNSFKNWVFKNNLFYRMSGNIINWSGKIYDYQHFLGVDRGSFIKDTGYGKDSFLTDPLLENDNMGIISNSPCIDKGINLGISEDYHGNPVPVGEGVDIGPFEYHSIENLHPPRLRILE